MKRNQPAWAVRKIKPKTKEEQAQMQAQMADALRAFAKDLGKALSKPMDIRKIRSK